ncbi:hypothetical protein HYU72_01120 [Candidatus Berkelbacteria bacterium]|nr:hypothetical protein [Candidatus Berkelbacteria bacterium]
MIQRRKGLLPLYSQMEAAGREVVRGYVKQVNSSVFTEEEMVESLVRNGAVKIGHFRLLFGLHSDVFLQCAAFLGNHENLTKVAKELAAKSREWHPDAVLGPLTIDAIFTLSVAEQLGVEHVLFADMNKSGRPVGLMPGLQLTKGERVLIATDMMTTGTGVKNLQEIVANAGATSVGVVAFAQRITPKNEGHVVTELPTKTLLTLEMSHWEKRECPLCRDSVPIVNALDIS